MDETAAGQTHGDSSGQSPDWLAGDQSPNKILDVGMRNGRLTDWIVDNSSSTAVEKWVSENVLFNRFIDRDYSKARSDARF